VPGWNNTDCTKFHVQDRIQLDLICHRDTSKTAGKGIFAWTFYSCIFAWTFYSCIFAWTFYSCIFAWTFYSCIFAWTFYSCVVEMSVILRRKRYRYQHTNWRTFRFLWDALLPCWQLDQLNLQKKSKKNFATTSAQLKDLIHDINYPATLSNAVKHGAWCDGTI